ncbi:MAG: acetate/propionate family kinase [Vulcanimicrobiota bacterium]
MNRILVINTGSSSLKFQLFNFDDLSLVAKGLVERIGESQPVFSNEFNGKKEKRIVKAPDHKAAFQVVIDDLLDPENNLLKDINEIKGVGHRVVHGAETFATTVQINKEVIKKMEECIPLAPLHNPPNLMGISAAQSLLPQVPQVGVFDTAFHQTMDPHAFIYGLPYEMYEKHRIRRYGFHGTSHKYVSKKLMDILNQGPEGLKIITCHLGNGSSIAAVKDGKSVDTSMGLTPLEGLVMGTRCGDMDPAVVTFIMDKENMDTKQVDRLMNKQSGMKGISGISNDFRDLWEAAEKNNKRAQLALDVYCYRIKKYLGAYAAAMGGVTDIIFTAGIGENDNGVREKSLEGLEFMGVKLDKKANAGKKSERKISTDDSRVRVWIIPTNEELMIARETREIIEVAKTPA